MPSIPATDKVLVIDDAAATRRRLCAWLAEEGVEVAACPVDQPTIFEHLDALRPGCVVIDVPVHDASGFELLFALRGRVPRCLLIVMTNELSDEFRRRCAAAQVQHCLDKATEFECIGELVRRHGAKP